MYHSTALLYLLIPVNYADRHLFMCTMMRLLVPGNWKDRQVLLAMRRKNTDASLLMPAFLRHLDRLLFDRLQGLKDHRYISRYMEKGAQNES